MRTIQASNVAIKSPTSQIASNTVPNRIEVESQHSQERYHPRSQLPRTILQKFSGEHSIVERMIMTSMGASAYLLAS